MFFVIPFRRNNTQRTQHIHKGALWAIQRNFYRTVIFQAGMGEVSHVDFAAAFAALL